MLALALLASVIVVTGCEFDHTVTGPVKNESISLDLNNAERANVELDMAAGELNIRGGTAKLLQGRVEYNVPQWKPQVVDDNNGQVANVTIRQGEHGHGGGNRRNRWDLELNDKILLDLDLSCGAGRARCAPGAHRHEAND